MNLKNGKEAGGKNVSTFSLALAGLGESVRIMFIRGGVGLEERLLSMNIKVGDLVEILQSREKGAVLVAKDDNRLVLGGGMAQRIFVAKEGENG